MLNPKQKTHQFTPRVTVTQHLDLRIAIDDDPRLLGPTNGRTGIARVDTVKVWWFKYLMNFLKQEDRPHKFGMQDA